LSLARRTITLEEAAEGIADVKRSAAVALLSAHGFEQQHPYYVHPEFSQYKFRFPEGIDPFVPSPLLKRIAAACTDITHIKEQAKQQRIEEQKVLARKELPDVHIPDTLGVERSNGHLILRSTEYPEIGMSLHARATQPQINAAIEGIEQMTHDHERQLQVLQHKYGYILAKDYVAGNKLVNPGYELPDIALPRFSNDSLPVLEQALAQADAQAYKAQDAILDVMKRYEDIGMPIHETEEDGVRVVHFTGDLEKQQRQVMSMISSDVSDMRRTGQRLLRMSQRDIDMLNATLSGHTHHGQKMRVIKDPDGKTPPIFRGEVDLMTMRNLGRTVVIMAEGIEHRKKNKSFDQVSIIKDMDLRAPVLSKAAVDQLNKIVQQRIELTISNLQLFTGFGFLEETKDKQGNTILHNKHTGDEVIIPASATPEQRCRLISELTVVLEQNLLLNKHLNGVLADLGAIGFHRDDETYVDDNGGLNVRHPLVPDRVVLYHEVETGPDRKSRELIHAKRQLVSQLRNALVDRLVEEGYAKTTGEDETVTLFHPNTGKTFSIPPLCIDPSNAPLINKTVHQAVNEAKTHRNTSAFTTKISALQTHYGCSQEGNRVRFPFIGPKALIIPSPSEAQALREFDRAYGDVVEAAESMLARKEYLKSALRNRGYQWDEDAQTRQLKISKEGKSKQVLTHGEASIISPDDLIQIAKWAGIHFIGNSGHSAGTARSKS